MLASIIITSYNYEMYIKECIDSCIAQDRFDNYEIIIINDGSTDNTEYILNEYIPNPKVKIFNNSNMGIEYASNFGIKQALGKYIVRVDADDILSKNFLNATISEIEKNNASFVYSDYYIIDNNSEVVDRMFLPDFNKKEILSRGDFLATGTLYKKEILEKIGLYNENNKNCGLESYELIVKLLKNDIMGLHINKFLFSYRRHNENMSKIRTDIIINYGKELFNKLSLGEYCTNEFHPYGLIIND